MKIILTENQIRQILNEQFDYSDAMRLEKALVDHYGTTDSSAEAGFITPSGYMLDFSEGSGSRVQDHRNISFVYDEHGIDKGKYDEPEWKQGRSGALYATLDMGFIRFSPESNGFDMRQMPTQEQFQLIRQLIGKFNGFIVLDLSEDTFMQYDAGTPAEYILTDIKNYYRHGMKPQPYKYADEDKLYESLVERIINKL